MISKDNKIKELEANIRKLESELKDEKKRNNILLAENKQLKQENSKLKNKINSYDNQQNINNNLLNEIKKLHKLQEQTILQSHNQLFNSITNLGNNNSNLSNNSNDSIIKLIKDKEDKINDLNEKLKRYPFILEKNEKIMSIIFSSVNQKINYSIVCKNTDNINKLEEELYKEYPNLFENQYYGKLLFYSPIELFVQEFQFSLKIFGQLLFLYLICKNKPFLKQKTILIFINFILKNILCNFFISFNKLLLIFC